MDDGGIYSTATVKARTLCTLHWFFTSHLTCFGLPEDPALIRKLTSSKVATSRASHGRAVHHQVKIMSKAPDEVTKEVAESVAQLDLAGPSKSTKLRRGESKLPMSAFVESINSLFIVVQDEDGYLHLFDSEKHEVQALGIEDKILRDASFHVG
ncbi:Aste57867_7509 [Aphanomyces stellatus]|uniref:Aste57867_7509 protein n=1 Tax=Aphanomyces stellatus TaxID=120398 RepID=A0A485KIE2_9STRA|nr:hypothetical protein As57867_007483 [Aphanomyces stellatus]VFT84418.1 Aste57867_7509 [Aphanomyces stellatus]